jgi:hypothetical protein
MTTVEEGSYVVCHRHNKTKIGRALKRNNNNDGWYVCFNENCKSVYVPDFQLVAIDNPEMLTGLKKPFGYHRFDKKCPDYNPETCATCACSGKEECQIKKERKQEPSGKPKYFEPLVPAYNAI